MIQSKRIFTISVIKNEMDIIESFVRYNINIFDGMIILDNNSTDDTVKILKHLKNEGLPLFIFKDQDNEFNQAVKINQLLLKAVNEFNADIIVPLDADEFLISSNNGNPRTFLEKIEFPTFNLVQWKTYIPDFGKNEQEKFIPAKLTFARYDAEEMGKVIIPKELVENYDVKIASGNHDLIYNSEYEGLIKRFLNTDLRIAHFPIRSREQIISKISVGWITELANVKRPEEQSWHWKNMFDELKKNGKMEEEDLIDFAKKYSSNSEKSVIKIKEDPVDLTFCKNTMIKYTNTKINPLTNLLEKSEGLSLDYLNFKKEAIIKEKKLKTQIEKVEEEKLAEEKRLKTQIEKVEEEKLAEEKRLKTQIEKLEKERDNQFKKLNSQINKMSADIYEMGYNDNNGRSFTQKLISRIPSLYILFNANETGFKNALTNIRGYKSIKNNRLFDVGFYLKNNRAVRRSGMDPILHYMYHGFSEGKKPSPKFDGNYYLKRYNDVKDSKLNPLVHYSLYGKKENRKYLPNKGKKFLDNEMNLRQISNDQINEIMEALTSKISVVIPIYNAFEETERCINSVLENTKLNYELILIDDCSTDKRIETLLNKMEKISHIKVIRNLKNGGFVKSVNIGMKESEGDVVLLNSDTQVTPGWLQKLVLNAYSAENIGTVTPLSNSAGVFSVPKISIKNEIPPFLTLNGMSTLVERVSEHINMEVPTGNGFCMFIKRDTINNVGFFDEENFGKGYGEENDFCMRAIEKSWKNIIDDSTYIFHEESSSFSSSKEELSKRNTDILNKKHPSYEEEVRKFVSSPKLKLIQDNIKSGLKNVNIETINKKRILYVVHEILHQGSGGTGYTNEDIIDNIQKTFECYVLTSTTKELTLWKVGKQLERIKHWTIQSKWSAKEFYNEEFRNIYFNILTGLKIDIVHIQHLFKHTFDLPEVAKRLNLPVILSFHDFYYLCPSIHLLDDNDEYCYGKCTSSTGQCRIPSEIFEDMPILKEFINTWRNEVSKIIGMCSAFTAPTKVTQDLYTSVYTQLKDKQFKVIEHGRDFNEMTLDFKLSPADKPVKILIPGNINKHKGSEFIKKLKSIDSENRLEFHFMGKISSELKEEGIYHGRYKREDFCKMVNKIQPSFIGIFSICPETYSHTLSEAWSCGIPVLATKIGALEERISREGGGWFLDNNSPSKSYNEIIRIVNSNEEYNKVVEEVKNIHLRTKKEMAFDYECMYWENLILDEHSNVQRIYKVAMFVHGKNDNFQSATYIRLLLAFYHPLLYGKVVPFVIDEEFLSKIDKNSFLSEKIYDCIIVQRDILDKSFAHFLVNKCEEHDIKLIYEIDDDLLDIDPTHPEYEIYSQKSEIITYLAKNADLVTVSTTNLKSKFENISNVKVIPNALDERLWFIKSNKKRSKSLDNEKIVKIGYMGTITHDEDLLMIKKVIKNLKKKFSKDNIKIKFDIIGGMGKKLNEKWFNQLEIPPKNINYPEFVKWLREVADWDIGIAPLSDTNINHCKSELKYLEYTGLNLPAVYSDIGSYSTSIKNGYNGLLVENNDLRQWEDQITLLINDRELHHNIINNAKKDVMENYLVKYRIDSWYHIIKSLVDDIS